MMSESDKHVDADSALRLATHARRCLDIANLLAIEMPDATEEIAGYLRAAWRDLAQLRADQVEPDFLPTSEREAFRAALKQLEDGEATPSPGELRRHARWLTLALAPAEARAGLPRPGRKTLTAGAGVLGLILAVVGGAFVWRAVMLGPTQWRVTLYARQDFSGRSVVRKYDTIDFRWAKNRPVFRIPHDDFSVRAETCLSIDEPTTLTFALLSDDGSRLFVDGTVAIDNWGEHGEKTLVGRFAFQPGVHHLRVDYFDHTENARLRLSVEDAEGNPIPGDRMRLPESDPDSPDPCGS